MKDEKVIGFLESCPASVLAQVLAKGLGARRERQETEDFQCKPVLAFATRSRQEGSDWEPWELSVVAPHDESDYPRGNHGEPFSQFGSCVSCKVACVSHLKNAVCPLCGGAVHLT